MIKYYPYAANDGKHMYCIITESGRKAYFGQADTFGFTLHKTRLEKIGIFYDTKIGITGLNQESILQAFELALAAAN
jgi:hypothetical protein